MRNEVTLCNRTFQLGIYSLMVSRPSACTPSLFRSRAQCYADFNEIDSVRSDLRIIRPIDTSRGKVVTSDHGVLYIGSGSIMTPTLP